MSSSQPLAVWSARAYQAIDACEQRQHEQRRQERRGKPLHSPALRLRYARAACDPAIKLFDDVCLLLDWLRNDILAVAGPSYDQRCVLYDFVVAELQSRVELCPAQLQPIHRLLKNGREEFLAFAKEIDENLDRLASEFQCSPELLPGCSRCFPVIRATPGATRRRQFSVHNCGAGSSRFVKRLTKCGQGRFEPVPWSRISTVACGAIFFFAAISAPTTSLCFSSSSTIDVFCGANAPSVLGDPRPRCSLAYPTRTG